MSRDGPTRRCYLLWLTVTLHYASLRGLHSGEVPLARTWGQRSHEVMARGKLVVWEEGLHALSELGSDRRPCALYLFRTETVRGVVRYVALH